MIDSGIRPPMKSDPQDFIVRDPAICGGMPVVKGTRVLLSTVLASLADGDSTETIMKSFPGVSAEAMRAIVSFAAASAREDLPLTPVGK